MHNVIIFLSAFVDALLIDTLYAGAMARVEKKIRRTVMFMSIAGAIIIFNFFIENAASRLIAGIIAAFFLSFLAYRAPLHTRIMTSVVFYCIYIVGDYFAYGVISFLAAQQEIPASYFILGALISYAYLVGFTLVYRLMPISFRDPSDQSSRLLILGASISCAAVMEIFISSIERVYGSSALPSYMLIIVGIFFLAFNFFIISFSNRIASLQEESRRRAVYESQITHYTRYNEIIEKLYDDMRGLYHDFPLHVRTMQGLIQEGKTGKIEEYGKNLLEMVPAGVRYSRTGNTAVDVCFSTYLSFAEEGGIRMEFDIAISQLYVRNVDLSIILGNALENALEACRELTNTPKPCIRITLKEHGNYMYFKTENPIEKEMSINNGLPATTKDVKAYHGYGLRNLLRAAKNYDGDVTCEVSNGLFILEILLLNRVDGMSSVHSVAP